ncbi:myeloid-associated differentiation marker homolog [Periophthalmus magnuspinnatus]|uniref:MARVEL domain-containing protein n=1 Tax=Periophthalmus magnuspinnatus TaxID=409849 RepID=A0A3B4A762_9GOBI|nr:myeloid-associated differentiation marker homolog [Periophthalmus magnuspinnatus]
MPVIVLEARDFTSPFFLVRTWVIVFTCATFSLVASLDLVDLNKDQSHLQTLKTFCMFIWCFFFSLTVFIYILTTIQFHSLLPISWKNFTVTVAVLGALMSLSAAVIFPWFIMDNQTPTPRAIATAITSWLTFLGYTFESWMLQCQTHEQRGYMGSKPGLLKTLQVWGGCQMIPLIVEAIHVMPSEIHGWQLWVSVASYTACLAMSLITLVVILGDFAARCCLPFDRFLAGFSLMGVFLYMVAAVICFTKILQLKDPRHNLTQRVVELFIIETVVASITLLAYTVDLAFSIKLLCDRGH